MTDPANAATFYLGSAVGGPVYRSRDKGLTWQRLLGDAGSLAVAPSRPATLYAVTLGKTVNRLQRSTNGGRRWTEVGPIPLDITKVVVDQEVPTTLYAATPGRGVWRSTDGGVNWTWVSASLTRVGRTGINSLTAHPVAPHTFYVTTSPGGLFEARFED
jgi:hypothetical protein